MPTDPIDPHDAVVLAVAERLKAHPGVAALVGDRVFHPGRGPSGERPQVVVTKGKARGVQRAAAPVLAQRDVRVECSAAAPAVLDLLLIATQTALNGVPGAAAYDRAVLTHTGDPDDADGVHSREDTYGVFVRLVPPDPVRAAALARSLPPVTDQADEIARLKARIAEMEAAGRERAAEAVPAAG